MNSKITNTQLSTTEPTKNKTKKTTRTGTESRKWKSHGWFSVRRGREWGRVQRVSSINGR